MSARACGIWPENYLGKLKKFLLQYSWSKTVYGFTGQKGNLEGDSLVHVQPMELLMH